MLQIDKEDTPSSSDFQKYSFVYAIYKDWKQINACLLCEKKKTLKKII